MEGTENNNKSKNKMIKQKFQNKNSISNICCCFNCCSNCFKKIKECFSKTSILCQFLIFFIPVLCILVVFLVITHINLFCQIYKFNFFTAIKEEFLRYCLSDLDDINFDLNKKKISLLFEDISNMVFFKIYFQELNSYGLLDNDTEKIFPDISIYDENIHQSLEQFNTIFSIPRNLSKKYIDDRKDCLSEIGKLYYYFYPLIATQSNLAGTFINQTFLISYAVDDNYEIEGEPLYFNYPRITDDFIQNNNFFPYNNLISPRIARIKDCKLDEEPNEDSNHVFNENWFIYFDCQFRTQPYFDFYMNSFHLNENNRGSINKTNVAVMHMHLFNNENKKYIIDLIFFLAQKSLDNVPFQDSVFTISNFTLNNRKYSDNQTYVINNNDITEIALSSQLDKYFHYGLTSKNNIFFGEGVFYDNIDINQLSEPSNEYSTISGFDFDMRYFSSFYLYIKLFETSFYTIEYMETDNINYFIFNGTEQIKSVCENFDFSVYINSLELNDIDCFNQKNLLYYSRDNIKNYFAEGLTLPYCICLPLYCIKNLEEDFDIGNIEFVEEIILPEKCQNNLLYYTNGIKEDNTDNIDKIDSSKIKLTFTESLDNYLENQFFKFTHEKKVLNGGLNFVMISIITNESMKSILIDFVENLNKQQVIFISVIVSGTIFIFILITILLIIFIYSISKVINNYIEKSYIFLKKLTDCKNKNDLEKNKDDNIILGDKNNYDRFPLLFEENAKEKNMNENELLNDLYKIYCDYNKISESNFIEEIEKKQKTKNLSKISKLSESNELFKLFVKLALYIPQFKIDINMDYDFYKDSKLIKNFNRNFSKKTNTHEEKEQILYTKSILQELLSTELVSDYGFITNLNFNYITNINLNNPNGNKNYIQSAIFKKVEEMNKKRMNEELIDKSVKEDFNVENIKIVFKNKNLIMKKLEEKFEQDDYLNLSKLESAFNTTLINSFYNYTKKIITSESNS